MRNLPVWEWLLLISLYFSVYIMADKDEELFIETFGTNNETSGVWQAVRNIASDEEKMKILCKRAHLKMGMPPDDVIDKPRLNWKLLSFFDYNNETIAATRPPIYADIVTYRVTRLTDHAWHFTKGTKADCVFFLIQWDAIMKEFRVGLEFCGVHVPV